MRVATYVLGDVRGRLVCTTRIILLRGGVTCKVGCHVRHSRKEGDNHFVEFHKHEVLSTSPRQYVCQCSSSFMLSVDKIYPPRYRQES
jgi:hypothetical protein